MASNPFDQFDTVSETSGNPFDQFDEKPAPEKSSVLRRVGDYGISALKGAIAVPEAAVGLADIVTGGRAGKAAEAVGFRPREAKEILDTYLSPEQQAANKEVSDAKGFLPTLGAAVKNPSTIAQTVVESVPSMLGGGVIARGVSKLIPKVAPVIAGAIGEGAVGAGSAAENVRQQTEDGTLGVKEIAPIVASGVGTAAFGAAGGRIAQKLGIADVDTLLAQGGAGMTQKGIARRIVEGGISEGVFEELPQSVQEQIWQNVALDKPLMEGVPESAAMGLLAGGVMGGVASGAFTNKQGQTQPAVQPAEQAQPEQPALGLPNYPNEPLISFPDGSSGTQRQAEEYINALPEDQRIQARAALYGYAPEAAAKIQEEVNKNPTLLLPNGRNETLVGFPDGSIGTRAQAEEYINGLPENERIAARASLLGYAPQPVAPAGPLARAAQKVIPASPIIPAGAANATIENAAAGLAAGAGGPGIDNGTGSAGIPVLGEPALPDSTTTETVPGSGNNLDLRNGDVADGALTPSAQQDQSADRNQVPIVAQTEPSNPVVSQITPNIDDKAAKDYGLPEGSAIKAGKGRLGSGKFMVELPNGESTNLHERVEDAVAEANRIINRGNAESSQRAEYERIAKRVSSKERLTDAEMKFVRLDSGRFNTVPWSKFSFVVRERLGFDGNGLKNKLRSEISKAQTQTGGVIEVINPVRGLELLAGAAEQKETLPAESLAPAAGSNTSPELRPITETIAKRRAVAEGQLGKGKAYGRVLAAAKDMMNGQPVKLGRLRIDVNELKGDKELHAAGKRLIEIASAPAKEATESRAQTAESYRKRIEDAKSKDVLNALASEIQKDESLTDQQAQDLDDVVFQRVDQFPDGEKQIAPAQPFDSASWDKARENRIKESKESGNTHLDQVPAYVETMRGKAIYYVHDPKVRGVIRTVDNSGNVYVDWSDKYSADKELASPSQEKRGKKSVTVYRTSLGAGDLKDYVFGNGDVKTHAVAQESSDDARKAEIEIARSNRAKAMIDERMKLNPSTDDLFAAMAKLGGLNKDDAVSEFGLDPADLGKYRTGILFSFTNGKRALTPDGMREALAQYGYDVGDTVTEFGDKLDNAIRGIQQERTQEDAVAEKIKAFEESQQEYSEAYDALSEADQETVDEIVDAAIAAIGDSQVSAIMAEVATENPGESVNTTFFRTQLKERINDHIAAQEARKQAGANAETEAGRTAENRGGESGVSPDDRQEVVAGNYLGIERSYSDAQDTLVTKPAGSWVYLIEGDGAFDSQPRYQVLFSIGGGKLTGGNAADTKAQAFAYGIKRASDFPGLSLKPEAGADLFGDNTATRQSIADAARAKDTKRNSGESNPDDFALTGSDRAADQAIARGARDLFDQPDEVSKSKEALDAAGVTGTDKLNTIAQVRDGKLTAEEVAEAHGTKIEDLGEKIGGARKDTSTKGGAKVAKTKTGDDRPTWAKRYEINQIAAAMDANIVGKWAIYDSRDKNRLGMPRQMGGSNNFYDTREAAEAELPELAVSQKHKVYATAQRPDGTYGYEIYRNVTDRKRVKIVDLVFGSRVEALEYMGKNAADILETNTTFGEIDLPTPDNVNRIGVERRTGDVKDTDFIDTFGFRGVEFGNWNNQIERQQFMNAAYDGLLDLADVLNLPPKALSLNGDLALAFGARGQGLTSAKAHYEREKSVINLTKENGAGSLAHEFFHAMDHYFGRQDGKASSEWKMDADGTRSLTAGKTPDSDYVSAGFSYKSNVRPELKEAYKKLMETIFRKAATYVEDTQQADKFVAAAKDRLAESLDKLRAELSQQKDQKYWKRKNAPASAEQLAEFDTIAEQLLNGQGLDAEYRDVGGKSRSRFGNMRRTNDALEKLSALHKDVRGRSGFDSASQSGVMDGLRQTMANYSLRLKTLSDAQAGQEKVKTVPTDFLMNARELDEGRGKDYWTTPHEMAARAFQGYIEDKIADKGGRSPFMNYGREGAGILTPWGVKFPFPRGDERKAINAALDKFVSEIQTKETEQGVALFSRGTGQSMKERIDAVIATNDETRGVPFVVSDNSPASLRMFGWEDLPVVMRTGSDGVMKLHYDHGLSSSAIADVMTNGLNKPVMMLQHIGRGDVESIWFVTDKLHNDEPIVIAVQPEAVGSTGKVNLVATALSRPWSSVASKIRNGDLLYRDTTARVHDAAKIAVQVAQKKYAQAPRSLLGIMPKSAPVRGRAYKVLSQSDLVKHEQASPDVTLSRGAGTGIPLAKAKSIADELAKKFPNLPAAIVVQSQSEIPAVQRDIERAKEEFKATGTEASYSKLERVSKNDIEGAYVDGKFYLVAGNIRSEARMREVFAHEGIGHLSVESMLDEVDPRMMPKLVNQVKMLDAGGNKYIRQLAAEVDKRQPGLDKETRAKEIIAFIAERGDQGVEMTSAVRSLWQRIVDGIKSFAKLVFDVDLTDRDVRDIVAMAARYAKGEDVVSLYAGGEQVMLSRDGDKKTPSLTTVSNSAPHAGWSSQTKIRGKDGKPAIVYRGASTSLREKHFDKENFGKNSGHISSGLGVWFSSSPKEAEAYGRPEKFALDMRNPKTIKVEDLPSFESVEAARKFGKNLEDQGYDGIAISATHLGGNVHYIAFSPDQVIASENRVMFSRAPQSEEASKYADLNRKFREEHITFMDKAKKWLKRQLAPGGLLPKSVFDEKIRRDSEFEVIEFDVKHLVNQLERAIQKDFNLSAGELDTKTQELLSDVMAGKIGDVPESTKVALLGMRQYIDQLSMQYIDGLAEQGKMLMQEAERTGDAKVIAEAQERFDLMQVIMGNVGQYVHRSYRAFDDPDWARAVPDATLDAARDYLIQRNLETMTPAIAAARAEIVLNEILKNGTAYDNMEAFIRESKLGAKDLSVLKTRKQIAPQIRALLGEYTDPRISFAKSATKMGRLIWNQKFLEKVLDVGMGNFLFTDETKPPEATAKIAADKSEVYSPLNGLWTFPETDQAFKDALGKEQMADWFRKVVQINGMVKYGKTVLSPTTAARNWMSAFFFSVANGHFDLRHMKRSVDGLKEYFTHGGDAAKLAYLRELKQLGVVYDTPYAGEMMRLLSDTNLSETLLMSKGKLKIKHAADMATKFYQYGDDFWKIIGYENEKRMWMDTGMPEQQAKEKAAERIRNTYPTYSMVGKGIQSLRRFPLAGTFVSFPAEIIRTSINMVRYLAEDYKDPVTRPLAVRRAAGMAIASSFAYAAQALSMAALGYDDDDEEAVRQMAAPWQRNSNLLFTGRDGNGNIRFLDMSFLDPYNYWKRPIVAVTRGQPFDEAMRDVADELLTPFFGVDILAGTIFEVLANKKETGAPVYQGHDDAINQLTDIADHLRKTVQPGILSNVERTYKALDGEVSPSGKKYDINDEAAAWVGFRVSTLDPKVALYYRSFDFKDAKAEADKSLRDAIRNPKGVDSEDLREAYDMTNKLRERAYQQMSQLVQAGQRSGMTNQQVYSTLKNSGISNQDIFYIRTGMAPKYRVNPQSMREQIIKARGTFGPEVAKEIRKRYAEVAAYQ